MPVKVDLKVLAEPTAVVVTDCLAVADRLGVEEEVGMG